MQIARYWALGEAAATPSDGQPLRIACWRWSEHSQDEAQQRADAAAQDAVRRVEAGAELGRGYGYSDRVPREEIVREIQQDDGQTTATLTRNSYGSLILNTSDLMFIDADAPSEPPLGKLARTVKGWFGRHEPGPAEALRQRLAQAASVHPEYTIRLYQTAAGFRCAVVNRPVPPGTAESDKLLANFEADPLYTQLCQGQQCYRVRLTPKHWRCGVSRPPHRFPWQDAQQQQRQREWEQQYEARCAPYATCRLLEQFGQQPVDARLQPLLQLHDQMTRANDDDQSIAGLA